MIQDYIFIDIYMIIAFLITYLLCSINPAIIICKKKIGQDIRKLGSGNAGTANAMRVLGKPLGLLVIVLDVAKVFLSYYLVTLMCKLFNQNIEGGIMSAFIVASVIGHCFPVYYGFRGGKGATVSIVVALIFNYKYAIICVIVSVIVYLITKIPSVSSLSGVILYLILTIVMSFKYTIPIVIVTLIVLFRHRNNIKRIFQGQEKIFKM